MLREFLTWWAARLSELVPARLRSRDPRPADALVAEILSDAASGADRIRLLIRRRRREAVAGAFALPSEALRTAIDRALRRTRSRSVVLRLARGEVLEREVTLPIAAERDLGGVLRYEMDRLTPFAAADLFWSYAVVHRDRVRDRLAVRLLLVPRAVIAATLQSLAAAGAPARVLETPQGEVITLDPIGGQGIVWRRRATLGLAAACAGLAATAVVLPVVRQSLALGAVEARIAALRPRVEEADALRRRIIAARASVDVVAAQRARSGDALAALAAVTEILPDDASLAELTLAQRKLTLRGQARRDPAGGAARLIALLAADPAIRNPGFTAPVIRNEASGTDLFSIQAEIAQ